MGRFARCFHGMPPWKQYGSTCWRKSRLVRVSKLRKCTPAAESSQGASLAIPATLDVRGLAFPGRPRGVTRAPSPWLLVFLHRALVKRFHTRDLMLCVDAKGTAPGVFKSPPARRARPSHRARVGHGYSP